MSFQNEAETIRHELSKLGWSMQDFVYEYDKHHNYKSKLTVESFKKQLIRKTTKSELLKNYLEFIYKHDNWIKLHGIKPVFIPDELDGSFILSVRNISKKITQKLK